MHTVKRKLGELIAVQPIPFPNIQSAWWGRPNPLTRSITHASPSSLCSQADKLYAVLCIDCAITCEQCHFDDPFRVPYCEEAMAHSTSQGGSTTIEQIAIDPGYWRAKASSKVILPCYNPDACEGGVTGSSNYCRKGYKGPCEL